MKGMMVLAPLYLAAAIAATPAAADMHYSASEAATVKAYVLTVDKVNRYEAANAAIKHDRRSNPALARELADKHDDDLTLGKLTAAMKASPVTMGYYRKAGLSDVDAVLLPCALTNASLSIMSPEMARQFPASAAQIAFVKAHPVNLSQIGTE